MRTNNRPAIITFTCLSSSCWLQARRTFSIKQCIAQSWSKYHDENHVLRKSKFNGRNNGWCLGYYCSLCMLDSNQIRHKIKSGPWSATRNWLESPIYFWALCWWLHILLSKTFTLLYDMFEEVCWCYSV